MRLHRFVAALAAGISLGCSAVHTSPEPESAQPPAVIPHSRWQASPPLGYAADAMRRNEPVGGTLVFHDLSITVLGTSPDSSSTASGASARDAVRLRLRAGNAADERTAHEGEAFNWNGFHVAVVAIYGKGELGGGLVALETATLASLPPVVANSDTAGGAALRLRVPQRITSITLHHEGSAKPLRPEDDPVAGLRALQSWGERDRNWWDVPYHYLIDLDGHVYEGREWHYMGETNTTYDPSGHLLISILGNYNLQEPTQAQLNAIADVMAWAVQKFDVPLDSIRGHYQYAQTDCPGKNLRKYLEDGTFRRMVVARLNKASPPAPSTLEVHAVHATSNPILSDGTDYTTDPAPLVADGKLYIITGRDTASVGVNDFMMPEWQMLVTSGDPMAGDWLHYPHFLKPDDVFKWAAPGRAYAAQIVRGPTGRYYLYAPVVYAAATTRDKFAIGVGVADTPLGPWTDAHPSGPVVSQSYPVANNIQNIDPTVLVDDDGRVYLYWGTFGRLKGVELERDMVTFKGTPVDVHTLDGFFEASWLFKRNGTYYMAYAANTAGPTSECTEAVYYACIAYGTSPSPLGPWTYRGVILDPVSSTTSHPGIIEYEGKWYITYHTADAKNGGHFRRSVAIDRVEWDDNVSPARIRKVVPTGGPPPDTTPTANIASYARIAASNMPVPVQYWLRAVNDGKVRVSPLPPDMWATWSHSNPPQQWIMYQWDQPETLTGASLHFWADHPAGSGAGVAPPRAWHLEFWNGDAWQGVHATSPYTNTPDADNRVDFSPVTTRCLRAVFDASTNGTTYAAVALQEWEAYSTRPRPPRRPSVKGAASPNCTAAAG